MVRDLGPRELNPWKSEYTRILVETRVLPEDELWNFNLSFFALYMLQSILRIGTWRQRNCEKMHACTSLRGSLMRWLPMYHDVSTYINFSKFQVKQLRYWGLSEVEFILKTMSNAKVHDELAFGAPETTCRVVLPDAVLGVSRGLQHLLKDIYMIKLNYIIIMFCL